MSATTALPSQRPPAPPAVSLEALEIRRLLSAALPDADLAPTGAEDAAAVYSVCNEVAGWDESEIDWDNDHAGLDPDADLSAHVFRSLLRRDADNTIWLWDGDRSTTPADEDGFLAGDTTGWKDVTARYVPDDAEVYGIAPSDTPAVNEPEHTTVLGQLRDDPFADADSDLPFLT